MLQALYRPLALTLFSDHLQVQVLQNWLKTTIYCVFVVLFWLQQMLCSYCETQNLRYHSWKASSWQMKIQMVSTTTMEKLIKPPVKIKNFLSDFSPVNIAVCSATSRHSIFTELVLLVLIQCFVFAFIRA